VRYAPLLSLIFGYFLGSIPFGYIIAKSQGINILTVGSRNVGATNVRRTVGLWAGAIVFLLDLAKGLAATLWPLLYFTTPDSRNLAAMGLVGALLGHMFSIFLRLKGGKGVAVAMGGFMVIEPNTLPLALATWMVVFAFGRFVSLASIFFALMLPLCSYLFCYCPFENFVALGTAALITARHLPNIRRLLGGTEFRFCKSDVERSHVAR
jgi:glycerol-3-phosphate acyltransferase PlsY